MPLLKPNTMNDILASELSRAASQPSDVKVQIMVPVLITSSHTSLDSKQQSANGRRSLPERIPAFGLLMAFLSVFCFSIASVIVRIETSLPAIEILVIRSSFQFVVYFLVTLLYQYRFFGESGHRVDLMLRSISGTISLSAVYVAYRLIPLSDASTIHFASPVFVTIFAYFLLKEPFTRLQIITGAITLTGVVVIAKPEFLFGSESAEVREMRFEGTCLAVLASMTAAFSMISLRKLKSTPVAVTVMWYSFTLVVLGSAYLTAANKWTLPTTTGTWLSLAGISVCGVFDQYLITLAFQYEKAGPISVVRTFNIVLCFIWEVLLLNEEIQLTSVLGATLICSCVIVLALVKWNKESPETFERIRREVCCFCPAPGPNAKAKRAALKAGKRAKRSLSKTSTKAVTPDKDLESGGVACGVDSANQGEDGNDSCGDNLRRVSKHLGGSSESIDSIDHVQNTVNSNAILLIKSEDEEDDDDHGGVAVKVKKVVAESRRSIRR